MRESGTAHRENSRFRLGNGSAGVTGTYRVLATNETVTFEI